MEKSVKRGLQKGKPSENVTRAKKISVGREVFHSLSPRAMRCLAKQDAMPKKNTNNARLGRILMFLLDSELNHASFVAERPH